MYYLLLSEGLLPSCRRRQLSHPLPFVSRCAQKAAVFRISRGRLPPSKIVVIKGQIVGGRPDGTSDVTQTIYRTLKFFAYVLQDSVPPYHFTYTSRENAHSRNLMDKKKIGNAQYERWKFLYDGTLNGIFFTVITLLFIIIYFGKLGCIFVHSVSFLLLNGRHRQALIKLT